MKKLSIGMAFMLILSLLLCPLASAEVITALATEVNPEHLEKTTSYARILGYNEKENTLTVQLFVPEIFSWEDVEYLKAGDSIYIHGREIVIETIEGSASDGYFTINDGDVFLMQYYSTHDGFRADYVAVYEYNDTPVLNELAVIECPVKDSLLFLDDINDETGFPLELPVVHTARELTARLLEEDASEAFGVGFTADNVYVVFDGEGNLAAIHRFYVPWQ